MTKPYFASCTEDLRSPMTLEVTNARGTEPFPLSKDQQPSTPGAQVGWGVNRHLTRTQWSQKEPAKVSSTTWARMKDSIWIRGVLNLSHQTCTWLTGSQERMESRVTCPLSGGDWVTLLYSCRKTYETRGEPEGIQVTIQAKPPKLLIKQKGSAPHPRDLFITRREAS